MSKSQKTEERISMKRRIREIKKLREKIVESIRYSENYWMIFKDNTFGMARILDLIYKKSYLEILFYPKSDIDDLSKPLVDIYSPLEKVLTFRNIVSKPDVDNDGMGNPSKIIERVDNLIEREFSKRFILLEKEVKLLDENFENYPINDDKFNRKVFFRISDQEYSLTLNFENYPLIPLIEFSKEIEKVIKLNIFLTYKTISSWDEAKPPHIVDVLNELTELLLNKLKLSVPRSSIYQITLNNLYISQNLYKISLNLHKGKSLGIYYEKETMKEEKDSTEILNLFEAIRGVYQNYRGKISLFGKDLREISHLEKKSFPLISHPYGSNIESKRINKALRYNQRVKLPGNKKKNITHLLDLANLSKRKNARVLSLPLIDKTLLYISRAILTSPDIIMISLPVQRFDKIEYDKFNKYIEKVKVQYRLTFLIHGPKEIVSVCDKILTIVKNTANLGSIEDFISDIPRSGEFLTVELLKPDPKVKEKLKKIKNAQIVEIRQNEQFKIYSEKSPKEIISEVMNIIGDNLYSFNRDIASLREYIELCKTN